MYILFQALEAELAARKPRTDVLLKRGEELQEQMPYASMKIEECTETLTSRWDSVEERAKQRKKRLQELLNLHQVGIVVYSVPQLIFNFQVFEDS